MIKNLQVNEIVQTVSKTHLFDSDFLFAVNTSDVEDGKILNPPFLPVKELKGQFKKTIKNGDILFSEIRPANRHFAVVDVDNPKQYVVSTKLMVLRKYNDEVDSEYFYYWLTNTSFLNILQRRAENRICSFPQITFELLSEYSVPVPDIDTQKQIAKILKKIDSKISLNNRINAELEAMAKTLYDYWFVQFDFPDESGKPYKSSGGKMVWNEELKREIPEGWEVQPLNSLCNIVLGGTPKTEESTYWNGNISWLNSGEVAQFPVISSAMKITQDGVDNSATSLMPINTVVVSITGNIRASYLAIDSCANQSVVGILESNNLKKSYLYPVISNMILNYKRISTGNCQQHINKGTIEDTLVIIPNSTILDRYYQSVDNAYSLLTNLSQENQKLSSLRDFLLPLLMNGQVVVKDEGINNR